MKKIGKHLSFANVVACLALFIALGGASYAAFKLPKNSVGAKQLKKGAVTPTKLSVAAKSTLTGPKGPQGATGATGPQGPKGETGSPATALWAVVDEAGELLHGTALHSEETAAGTYFVTFARDVSGCAFVATTREKVAMASVAPSSKSSNGVIVYLENAIKQITAPFSLAVFC